jgi:hypothetical protein
MDELIQMFNRNAVRYLLIGGQAVRLEGMPRFSMDWDFFIPPRDKENVDTINRLLERELDVPILPLGKAGENFVQTYQTRWGILQFHLGGPGLPDFELAERRACTHKMETGTAVKCLSPRDLLESKKRANRPEDQADIRFLECKLAAGLS